MFRDRYGLTGAGMALVAFLVAGVITGLVFGGIALFSGPPALKSGRIIAKRYLPESQGFYLIPIVISTGKSTIVSMIPEFYTNPQEWQIDLSAQKRTSWIDLSESGYGKVRIGQWYQGAVLPAAARHQLSATKAGAK